MTNRNARNSITIFELQSYGKPKSVPLIKSWTNEKLGNGRDKKWINWKEKNKKIAEKKERNT